MPLKWLEKDNNQHPSVEGIHESLFPVGPVVKTKAEVHTSENSATWVLIFSGVQCSARKVLRFATGVGFFAGDHTNGFYLLVNPNH